MKPFVSAAALAAALALPGMPVMAQQTTTETDTQQNTTETATQQNTTQTDTQQTGFKVISNADDLEGLEPQEVRIEDVETAPRDQVQAINSSLDSSNPQAMELREQISGMDAVKQALADEDVEEERVVGAAIEEGALVLYVLPEG